MKKRTEKPPVKPAARWLRADSPLLPVAGNSTTLLAPHLIISLAGYVIVSPLAYVWISWLRRLVVLRGWRAVRAAQAVIG
jgi:hypothetical protein